MTPYTSIVPLPGPKDIRELVSMSRGGRGIRVGGDNGAIIGFSGGASFSGEWKTSWRAGCRRGGTAGSCRAGWTAGSWGGGRAADSRRLVAALLPSIGTGTVHEVNNKFNFNAFEFRRHRKTTKC